MSIWYSEACREIEGMHVLKEKTQTLRELNEYLKKYKHKKLFYLRNELRKTKRRDVEKINKILSEIKSEQWLMCALNELGR